MDADDCVISGVIDPHPECLAPFSSKSFVFPKPTSLKILILAPGCVFASSDQSVSGSARAKYNPSVRFVQI
jgi:hypothetical protein